MTDRAEYTGPERKEQEPPVSTEPPQPQPNGHDKDGAEAPEASPDAAQAALCEALDRLVVYAKPRMFVPDGMIETAALWSGFSYIYLRPEIRKATRLLITAADIESGKTTVMELLKFTASHPYYTIKLNEPVLRDMLDAGHTMLLDEAEHYISRIVTLADGWARGDLMPIKVANPKGGWNTEHRGTFAPVAIAMNGKPAPTIRSRSIELEMEPGDAEIDWDDEVAPADLEPVRLGFSTWRSLLPPAESCRLQLPYEPPDMPKRRTKQKWMPLFLVAAAAGPRWYETALDAYRKLEGSNGPARSEQSLMLESVWRVFQDSEDQHLLPVTLAARVQQQFSHRYDKLTPTWMTQRLKMYGLDTRSVKMPQPGTARKSARSVWCRDDIEAAVQKHLVARGVKLEATAEEIERNLNRASWRDAADDDD